MRRWWRRKKLEWAIRFAKEADCEVVTEDWLVEMYRTLRDQNRSLGI